MPEDLHILRKKLPSIADRIIETVLELSIILEDDLINKSYEVGRGIKEWSTPPIKMRSDFLEKGQDLYFKTNQIIMSIEDPDRYEQDKPLMK